MAKKKDDEQRKFGRAPMDPKERRSEALIVNVRPVDRTRLDKLSAKTGQSRSTIIHEAILAYLEEG